MQPASIAAEHASALDLRDAVDLLARNLGSQAEAQRTFLERAQIGLLRCYAARIIGFDDGLPYDVRDWPIPAPLWLRVDSISDVDWTRGIFAVAPQADLYAELSEQPSPALRILGVRVGIESLNDTVDSLPVEWINAKDAIDLMLPMFGQGSALAAAKALAKRAHNDLVRARARLFKWEEPEGGAHNSSSKVEHEAEFARIPKGLWWAEGQEALTQNWVSGDFSTWIDQTYHWQAFGVEFARRDVEIMVPVRTRSVAERIEPDPLAGHGKALSEGTGGNSERATSAPGRKPAHWWPDFSAELAIYIHEEGLPAGDGTDGQGVVLNAVLSRLAKRGTQEPSRSTVQSVVNDVLRRLRSAGN